MSRGLSLPEDDAPAVTAPRQRDRQATLPTPVGLVAPPAAARMLEVAPMAPAQLALLGAHGGAGVSSLLRAGLDQVAVDAGRRWPQAGAVVLVARTSTSGLEWARDLARQHASGRTGHHVELVGLVLIPDAPGRVPARTAGLRDLVRGAFPLCWQLPWLEEWRLAAATEPLPAHPDVEHLIGELAHRPQPPAHHLFPITRMSRSRGDQL